MSWKELWPFSRLVGGRSTDDPALALYSAAVTQARQPGLYLDFAVPDTVDGRFDLIALHVYLLLRRLRVEGEAAKPLSQALADLMFDDMDRSLREMGVGDMGVGKRVRRMAEAFYGRMAAYDAALRDGPAAVESALARNVYRGATPEPARLAGLARYVEGQIAALDAQAYERLAAGHAAFAEI